MGPFCDGVDQSGGAFKYGLVGVYTVPIDDAGAPLPEGLSQLRIGSRLDREEEFPAQCVGEDGLEMGEGELPGSAARRECRGSCDPATRSFGKKVEGVPPGQEGDESEEHHVWSAHSFPGSGVG